MYKCVSEFGVKIKMTPWRWRDYDENDERFHNKNTKWMGMGINANPPKPSYVYIPITRHTWLWFLIYLLVPCTTKLSSILILRFENWNAKIFYKIRTTTDDDYTTRNSIIKIWQIIKSTVFLCVTHTSRFHLLHHKFIQTDNRTERF